MKRTVIILLGLVMALHGFAQLPLYDTSVYTFIRSAATDSVILKQQQWYSEQTVMLSGTVTDQNNQPLQGALAIWGNNQHRATTDLQGRFAFNLPHHALSAYNVVSVAAQGKKTTAQTLHWTSFPASVHFQMQPLVRCGCPPDSIQARCCNISIRMTIDELFEKEKAVPAKKGLRQKTYKRKAKRG